MVQRVEGWLRLAMSKVFVFGAGASTEYRSVTHLPVPIDSTFWGVVEIIIEKSKKDPPKLTESERVDLPQLSQFLRDRYQVTALKDLNEMGIEAVFKEIYENTPNKIPQFQRLLEWTLFWIIRKIDKSSAPAHYTFVQSKIQPGDSIITFNYDIILDQIVWQLASENRNSIKWHPSTGYGITFKGYLDQLQPSQKDQLLALETDPSSIHIYKLHGSLGWFLQAPAGELVLYLSGKPERGWLASKGYLSGQLLLIPPIPEKDFPFEPLQEVWEQAEKALNNAEKVYFIGYRFPQIDLRALRLFESSCKNKVAELVLKGKKSEEEWKRITNILPYLTPSSRADRTFSIWLQSENL